MSSPLKQNTTTIQNLLNKIQAMPDKDGGIILPELTNEGTSSDLLSGKQFIDGDGKIVVGNMQPKISSDLTANGDTVVAPAGYYSTQATKSVTTVTQATPSVSINSSGLVTASATQTAGYVSAGTKSGTKQLTTQAAKTVTPSTSSQIAVASGIYTTGAVTVGAIPSAYVKPAATKAATTYTPTTSNQTIAAGTYCSGTQTIAGDTNLVSENIKNGVSIFGVNGIYDGRAANTDFEDGLLTGAISTYTNSRVTAIGSSAFYGCSSLTTASFPNASTIGQATFRDCTSLTSASFTKVTSIGADAFARCYELTSLYLTGSSVCALSNSNAFSSTPIGGYSASAGTYGSIYVPALLLTSYKNATNWTYFSSRFTCFGDFYFAPIASMNALINTTTNVSTAISVKDGASAPAITITSDNSSIASVSNVTVTSAAISFDIITHGVEGKATITISAANANDSQVETFIVEVLEELPKASYVVEAIQNVSYGFELNNEGYYESKNKGKNNSYAICRVNINAPIDTPMYVDCINFAESNYDYGLLSNLDTALTLSPYADSTNVYHNFKGKQTASVQTVTYNVPAGEHFIYAKFIKDSSAASGNDTLQFKIRFE